MNTQIEEVVKIMERGQITLPVEMRRQLDLTPKALLTVILRPGHEIVLRPYKKSKRERLDNFLKKMAGDKNIYWTKEDEKRRQQVRKSSDKRARDLSKW